MTKRIGSGDPTLAMYVRAQNYCLEVAQDVVDEINRNPIPIDTGALAGVDGVHKGYQAVRYGNGAAVVNEQEYWKYVEFGTRYQNPQPHIRPAYETVRLKRKSRRRR